MRDFQKPERSQVFSSNGMIATSHPLAAKIGLDAMSKGGNAIDAAITSALMLVLWNHNLLDYLEMHLQLLKQKNQKTSLV